MELRLGDLGRRARAVTELQRLVTPVYQLVRAGNSHYYFRSTRILRGPSRLSGR